MNSAFDQIIAASDEDRLGLFTATALRLGTTPQNAEKDFWVCWVLDALFNGRKPDAPRLLFKGGTSLSKGFGLIRRFSEEFQRGGSFRVGGSGAFEECDGVPLETWRLDRGLIAAAPRRSEVSRTIGEIALKFLLGPRPAL